MLCECSRLLTNQPANQPTNNPCEMRCDACARYILIMIHDTYMGCRVSNRFDSYINTYVLTYINTYINTLHGPRRHAGLAIPRSWAHRDSSVESLAVWRDDPSS